MSHDDLVARLGGIDIYVLDQLMRGRIPPGARILDAGCGQGRNLAWFLAEGYDVSAVDRDVAAINAVRRAAAALAPGLPATNFRVEPIEHMSFPPAGADVVLCSAVLHFADSDQHFLAMLEACWRALRPGGLFFCRLASRIGMAAERFEAIGSGRYLVPDGSTRYLVDEAQLLALSAELGGELLDPIKTTVVQDLRCMTTWVLRKQPS